MNLTTYISQGLASLAAGALLGAASLAGQPENSIPLPAEGCTATNLKAEAARVLYNKDTQQLSFYNLSSLSQDAISSAEVSIKQKDSTTTLENKDWKAGANDNAVDWVFIIDESLSMRKNKNKNKRIFLREGLGVVKHLVKEGMAPQDTISVNLLAADITPLGTGKVGSSTLLKAIDDALKTKAPRKGDSKTTDIFHFAAEYVRKHTPTEGRTTVLVLISDADDEIKNRDSLKDLAKEKKVPVCSLVFNSRTRDTRVNDMMWLSGETGGFFHLQKEKCDDNTTRRICKGLNNNAHTPSCQFGVVLPPYKSDAVLGLLLKLEESDKTAELKMTASALDEIRNHFAPKAPDKPSAEEQAINKLISGITAAGLTIESLEKAEKDTPADYLALSKVLQTLRQQMGKLRESCVAVKKQPAENIQKVLAAKQEQDKDNKILARIADFCNNKDLTADNIQESHVLKLIGREKELPMPEKDLIIKLMADIKSAEPEVEDLAKAEAKDAEDFEVLTPLINKLREKVEALLPLCRTLKRVDAEAVKSAIAAELERTDSTQDDRKILTRIRELHENKSVTDVTLGEKEVLALLGRSTPLPVAPPPSDIPVWVYWASGSGLVLMLVIIGICVAHSRKKQKEMEAELERIRLEEEEADRKAEQQQQREREEELARKAEKERLIREAKEKELQQMKNRNIADASAGNVDPGSILAELHDLTGKKKWFITGSSVSIGRHATNDLAFANDHTLSGTHCSITRDGHGRWFITDNHSTNGIVINGRQYTGTFQLNPDGSQFILGGRQFHFVVPIERRMNPINSNSNNNEKTHVYRPQ